MTLTVPTPADISVKFPIFKGVDSMAIQFAIDEASCVIDECWSEIVGGGDEGQKTFTLAYCLYVCHALTLNGHGSGVEAKLAAQGLTGFETIRSGELSVSRRASSSQSLESEGPLATTNHGRRFIELRNRLFSGPRIAGVC